MELSMISKWRVSILKSRTEFVSYVLEIHQHYNCGHYQGKQLNHTKESGL